MTVLFIDKVLLWSGTILLILRKVNMKLMGLLPFNHGSIFFNISLMTVYDCYIKGKQYKLNDINISLHKFSPHLL